MVLAQVPECLVRLSPPSGDLLLDWLRAHVSRLMLEEISRNDREENVPEHLAAIEASMSLNPPDGGLVGYGMEVLNLERWSEPEVRYLDAPPSGARGHVQRLLACTLLLREATYVETNCGCDDDSFLKGSAPTLIQLTRSAVALGDDTSRLALGFLLWVRGKQSHPAFTPFVSFCILLLGIRIGLNRFSDIQFLELFVWVEHDEAHCREVLGYHVNSERWLSGINSLVNLRRNRDRLVDAGMRILAHPMIGYPQTRKRLGEMLDRIAG